MKTIQIINGRFRIPREYHLSKENRKCIIKTESMTQIERLLEGDIQIQTQFWSLKKPRKSHKGLIEINGEFYKAKRK